MRAVVKCAVCHVIRFEKDVMLSREHMDYICRDRTRCEIPTVEAVKARERRQKARAGGKARDTRSHKAKSGWQRDEQRSRFASAKSR